MSLSWTAFGLGIDRLNDRIGGSIYEGEAIAPNGDLETGSFLEFGPVSMFSSADSGVAGYVDRHGVDVPKVVAVDEQLNAQAAAVVADGKGEMILDVTLGDALAIEGAKETLAEHIGKGGIWVAPILFFAGLSTILAIYKVVEIYRIPLPDLGSLTSILALVSQWG